MLAVFRVHSPRHLAANREIPETSPKLSLEDKKEIRALDARSQPIRNRPIHAHIECLRMSPPMIPGLPVIVPTRATS